MGQCGCGDTRIDKAFLLPDGKIVAYDIYWGCPECHSGPAVMVYVYPDANSPWLEGVAPEPFTPSEDGGEGGLGIPVSFFEVEDLIEAASTIGSTKTARDGYRNFEDWMRDNGLRMVQDAMRIYASRTSKVGPIVSSE